MKTHDEKMAEMQALSNAAAAKRARIAAEVDSLIAAIRSKRTEHPPLAPTVGDDKVLTATDAEQLMAIADDLEQLAEAIRWRAVKGELASQLSGANRELTRLERKLDQIIHTSA